MLGKLLRQPFRWLEEFEPEPSDDNKDQSVISDEMDDAQETPVVWDPYEPTILDAIVVKRMLNKALNLPIELVDSIVDLAEYWPHTTTEVDYTKRPRIDRRDAHGGRPSEDQFLIRTPPLGFARSAYSSPEDIEAVPQPQLLENEFEPSDFQTLASPRAATTLVRPCRKIVFTFLSSDQGWGTTGRPGKYIDSWTWFEVGLERCNKKTTSTIPSFNPSSLATLDPPIEKDTPTGETSFAYPLLPREDRKIQCNVTVNHNKIEHRVVWSYTDDINLRTSTPSSSQQKQKKSTTAGGEEGNSVGTDDPWKAGNTTTTGSESPSEDGETSAAAEAFESPEVKALEDMGRGKATGDGEFVRNLKLGDIVTVWAKARFAGWLNDVDRVKVDVYWAV